MSTSMIDHPVRQPLLDRWSSKGISYLGIPIQKVDEKELLGCYQNIKNVRALGKLEKGDLETGDYFRVVNPFYRDGSSFDITTVSQKPHGTFVLQLLGNYLETGQLRLPAYTVDQLAVPGIDPHQIKSEMIYFSKDRGGVVNGLSESETIMSTSMIDHLVHQLLHDRWSSKGISYLVIPIQKVDAKELLGCYQNIKNVRALGKLEKGDLETGNMNSSRDFLMDYVYSTGSSDFPKERDEERVAVKMRQLAQLLATILVKNQAALEFYFRKPNRPATLDANFGIDPYKLTSASTDDYGKDQDRVNGLPELDKCSQKKLKSWQDVKELKEMNTSQVEGTAQLTLLAASAPPTAASQVVCPHIDSVPHQAICPSGSPSSPNPIPHDPTIIPPTPVSDGRISTPPTNTSNGGTPPPPLNSMSVGGSSPPPNPMPIERTASCISSEEFQRAWFTLVGILAGAAIALGQGADTKQNKLVRSLNLTAQISFAMSFLFAVIGLAYICILHSCGNARNRNQGNFSHHTFKICTFAATTGFMIVGIFVVLSMNIGKAYLH